MVMVMKESFIKKYIRMLLYKSLKESQSMRILANPLVRPCPLMIIVYHLLYIVSSRVSFMPLTKSVRFFMFMFITSLRWSFRSMLLEIEVSIITVVDIGCH